MTSAIKTFPAKSPWAGNMAKSMVTVHSITHECWQIAKIYFHKLLHVEIFLRRLEELIALLVSWDTSFSKNLKA